jgi:hypothetical protein
MYRKSVKNNFISYLGLSKKQVNKILKQVQDDRKKQSPPDESQDPLIQQEECIIQTHIFCN